MKMRELAEVKTLRQRRIDACDKFANACQKSERFSEWFPLRPVGRSGVRRGEVFKEEFARCNRLRDSPLFFMRRRLNGKDGKTYGKRNEEYRSENQTGRSANRPFFQKKNRLFPAPTNT